MHPLPYCTRRSVVRALAFSAAALAAPGVFAEELRRTARLMEGPYYPNPLPLEKDNDLLIVNDSITPAVGEVTHLRGRVLDVKGRPLRNALVEIWQTDSKGIYLLDRDRAGVQYDGNFQGYGAFETGSTGGYYFRTLKPVPYPPRLAPHIHFGVRYGGRPMWTTQLNIQGHPGNARDSLYRTLSPADAATVTVGFTPLPDSRIGELAATFDIVLDRTFTDTPS